MSRSNVNETIPREQFTSIGAIFFFLAAVIVVLYLMFAKEDLLEEVTHQVKPSMVTVEYLEELISIYPKDISLKLALVQELIRLYEIPRAKALIQELPNTLSKINAERKQWLEYRLDYAEYSSLTDSNPLKQQAKAHLIHAISQLNNSSLTTTQILDLAESALAVKEIALVKAIYPKLDSVKHELSVGEYVQAAKLALAVGEYEQSSNYFFKAQTLSPELSLKREYFRLGVNALQQGNMVQHALEKAEEKVVGLPLDRETSMMLVRLALAANQPNVAEKYIQRILKLQKVNTQ